MKVRRTRSTSAQAPTSEKLAQAVAQARDTFANADEIVPVWTPNGNHEIVVEVWLNGRARVLPPTISREDAIALMPAAVSA